MIDWTSKVRATKSTKLSRRQWMTKLRHLWSRHDDDEAQKQWWTPAYPRCGQDEDATHVWLCKNEVATEEIHLDTQRVDHDQTENPPGTCRNYCPTPTPMAQHWTTDTIYIILVPCTPGRTTTSRPSWMASTIRRLPRYRMECVQQSGYVWQASRKTGCWWTTSLIIKLWDVA